MKIKAPVRSLNLKKIERRLKRNGICSMLLNDNREILDRAVESLSE